ncbi:uncharacterized protein LOC143105432 [Alosa pseudoharengus]|uniref:uncharacterized protein LOC143105432 n=1 Tax=Alosa pseudoharengus TaxID=34774 RepID=UPI003F88E787
MRTVWRTLGHIFWELTQNCQTGGFEILRLGGMTRSKKLSVMPCPSTGYTIKFIKNTIKSAIIYIRPMQKNINVIPVELEAVVPGPKEKCIFCHEDIFFNDLKDHLKHCRHSSENGRASPNVICTPDSPEYCCFTPSPNEANGESSTDAAPLQLIDLTEDEAMQESLDEWRAVRHQQDQEYQDSLVADQEKHDLLTASSEIDERRRKIIRERQLRMAHISEAAHGVPLRFKYPSGIIRTRRFELSESIQILFDFVGENDDATECFHIQDALSIATLKSNMSGTLLENNIRGSRTLYVHWVQPDDPEFEPALDSNQEIEHSNSDNFAPSSLLSSPVLSRCSSPERYVVIEIQYMVLV